MAGAALARLRARRRTGHHPDDGDRPAGASRSSSAKRQIDTPHYVGHRERLRQRLIEAGAESLPDYELFEVILFASNPRGDVKPLAKELLDHFGGFAAVMSADPDALFAAGLGPAGIAAIKSVREAALRLMRAELQERPVVSSWDQADRLLQRPRRARQDRGIPHPVPRSQERADQA